MICILCGSSHLVQIGDLRRDDVISLYRRKLRVDVSSLITSDLHIYRCKECDLTLYDPLIAGDEEFYGALQKHPWYYEGDKAEFKWAASRIPDGLAVLEVGAGAGRFAAHIPTCSYVGLDLSDGAKAIAKERGVTIQTVPVEAWADKHQGMYDVVCHFQVLEHVTSPRSFLLACAKALKPGGRLMISLPAEDSYLSRVYNNALNMPPHHLSRWSDKSLIAAGDVIGCKVDEIYHEPVSDVHRPLLAIEALRDRWIRNLSPIDLRFVTRTKMAILCRVVRLLRLDTIDPLFLGHGNAVNVVYTKVSIL